jgi:uncharacterized membrane protein YuzA (DUF378 family)
MLKTLQNIALALVIIGAINWGLIGFFQFNLVAALFGENTFLSRLVYGLVGLSGIVCLSLFMRQENAAEENVNRPVPGKLNYSTEFAEENDLSNARKNPKE